MSTDPHGRHAADGGASQAAAEATVRRFLADDATAQALGVTVSDVAPGTVSAHMTIRPDMLNGHGTAHGATLFALGDIAFAMACNSHGTPAVARSCSIEYLSPAAAGDAITASAVERSVVGRTGIYDIAIVRDADGKLLAEMRGHSRVVGSGR